jgi:pimeloyl-ACP methyl ester carboxylesterase
MPGSRSAGENSADIEICYEDHGPGQPAVLIHGYRLSGRARDKQVPALPRKTEPLNDTATAQEAGPSIPRTSPATASPG